MTLVTAMLNGDSRTLGLGAESAATATGWRKKVYDKIVAAGHAIDFVGPDSSGAPGAWDHDNNAHPGYRLVDLRLGYVPSPYTGPITTPGIVQYMATFRPMIAVVDGGINDIGAAQKQYAAQRMADIADDIHIAAQLLGYTVLVFICDLAPVPGVPTDYVWGGVADFNAALPVIV